MLIIACSSEPDKYAPMVEDDFFFYILGEVREYQVSPKFYSATEVALLSSGTDLPQYLMRKDPPRWKIKAQAYRSGKLIQEFYLKPEAGWYKGKDMSHFKSLSLGSFSEVDFEIFPQPMTIRLTVEEIDDRYATARPTIRLAIRTSPIP